MVRSRCFRSRVELDDFWFARRAPHINRADRVTVEHCE